jgi:hypothetical protein
VIFCIGPSETRIISKSGMFDTDITWLTLGYLPEGKGEHYTSVFVSQLQHFVDESNVRISDDIL